MALTHQTSLAPRHLPRERALTSPSEYPACAPAFQPELNKSAKCSTRGCDTPAVSANYRRAIRVLFIQRHPNALCKPPMYSKHPHPPPPQEETRRLCGAVPGRPTQPPRGGRKPRSADVTRGDLCAGAVPALWSVGLPFQSRRLRRLPASGAGFGSVGLSSGCAWLGGVPSPCFLMRYY